MIGIGFSDEQAKRKMITTATLLSVCLFAVGVCLGGIGINWCRVTPSGAATSDAVRALSIDGESRAHEQALGVVAKDVRGLLHVIATHEKSDDKRVAHYATCYLEEFAKQIVERNKERK